MAEKKIKWTEQQERAIRERGSDVLVTASAGTGKTTVLSGRCVNIVSDKTICEDVLGVLVLTFTDAAAEQMRSRIAEQLRTAYLESDDAHLRRQLILLGGADISTIHSFCKRLITEYFYKLELDPTFRIIDADEQRLLKAEVLEQTIEWAWGQSNLQQGLGQLLGRRDLRASDGFLARIIEISNFLDGVIWRKDWYERAIKLAEAVNPFTTDLGKKQKEIVAERLEDILGQVRHAQKLYTSSGGEGDWADKLEESFVKYVTQCIGYLRTGDWDKCAEQIRDFDKPRVYKPKDIDKSTAEFLQRTVKSAVDYFEGLGDFAILNPDYLDRVGGSAGLQTRVLIELIKKFDELYGRAKRAINCLDFADLEHYALELLADEKSSEDELVPSETAVALRRRYKYIFVDEYQDINAVQKAILELLSREGNVFVVGDVKQSIYAFRGAKPEIFEKEIKLASVDPKDIVGGLRVDLNKNWRSAKGILDFVNKIFGRIMTGYDESARLRPGIEQKPADGGEVVVEFHILDEQERDRELQDDESGESAEDESLGVISGRQRQAAMIARRIREMIGAETGKAEFQIYDKQQDCFRDVKYGDIVILMRSLAKKARDYVEVLRLAGVPVSCEATAGYFETTEISDILCLLNVLDNPQRDIELAAILRSPLFGISDSELAKIKMHSRQQEQDKNYYDCTAEYCASGADAKLAGKLKEILEQIERWQGLGRRGNLADLVWQVYRQTGYLGYVSALPNGRWRRANLLKLHERAIQFEGFASSGGVPSLRRFVEFIERLQEAGEDWAPAEPEGQIGDAVRILSVHKSKGLEFAVVFLAELDSEFNKKDARSEVLADAGDTVGLQIIDRDSNSKLSSLAHQVIAEEIRILYVAMTRARERLILSACEKKNHCRDIVRSGFSFGEGDIPNWQLRRCRSSLEWVLYGLCEQKSLHSMFETGLAGEGIDDGLFNLKLYGQAELEELSRYILKLKANKSKRSAGVKRKAGAKRKEGKLLSQIKESLAWRYRFGDVAVLAAKQSVTQLTHRSDEYIKIDYSRALQRRPKVVLSGEPAETIDGRLIGAATHLVISRLDLAEHINKKAIEKIKEKLLDEGAITEVIAERIDNESIVRFFESELGREVLDAGNEVLREWPFTFALPASELSDTRDEAGVTKDEIIVVQGIIDMVVRTRDGLLIIDFKSDDVTSEEVCERAELYRKQLELYGRAAEAILREEVVSKLVYFLRPGCAVAL